MNAGLSLLVNVFHKLLHNRCRAIDRDEFDVPCQTKNEEPHGSVGSFLPRSW